ncbi:hypothetical protein, partial [Xanthomonas hortorum]|uniref:hypothetical protein n=1 Tax=Xanthomonas hortorum TaxID=56454 RepID=UPI0020438D83
CCRSLGLLAGVTEAASSMQGVAWTKAGLLFISRTPAAQHSARVKNPTDPGPVAAASSNKYPTASD